MAYPLPYGLYGGLDYGLLSMPYYNPLIHPQLSPPTVPLSPRGSLIPSPLSRYDPMFSPRRTSPLRTSMDAPYERPVGHQDISKYSPTTNRPITPPSTRPLASHSPTYPKPGTEPPINTHTSSLPPLKSDTPAAAASEYQNVNINNYPQQIVNKRSTTPPTRATTASPSYSPNTPNSPNLYNNTTSPSMAYRPVADYPDASLTGRTNSPTPVRSITPSHPIANVERSTTPRRAIPSNNSPNYSLTSPTSQPLPNPTNALPSPTSNQPRSQYSPTHSSPALNLSQPNSSPANLNQASPVRELLRVSIGRDSPRTVEVVRLPEPSPSRVDGTYSPTARYPSNPTHVDRSNTADNRNHHDDFVLKPLPRSPNCQ